jgi:hypothetical protein
MENGTNSIQSHIQTIKSKLKAEMPRITKEIQVYEEKLAKGLTNKNPSPAPQFRNG